MTFEENALSVLINMGLNMAKSQVSQALQVPEMGYPGLKKCIGLEFVRPQISIEEGALRIVTDFDIQAGSMECESIGEPGLTVTDEDVPDGFFQETMQNEQMNAEMEAMGYKERSFGAADPDQVERTREAMRLSLIHI